MTIEEFGQTIKQKYPAYSKYSDAEIGQKVLAKYPQYKSKVNADSATRDPIHMHTGILPRSGIIHDIVQETAKPFFGALETGKAIVGGLGGLGAYGIGKLTGQKDIAQAGLEYAKKATSGAPEDFGDFGKVGPFQTAKEAIDAGTDVGLWFVGGPEAKGVAKAAVESTKILPKLWKATKTGAKVGAGFGATHGFERGVSGLVEKPPSGILEGALRVGGQTALEASVGTVGGAALAPAIELALRPFAPIAEWLGGRTEAGKVETAFQKGVKPSFTQMKTEAQASKYMKRAESATRTIVENKDAIALVNENGERQPGLLPKTIQQFRDAISQVKKTIYEKYSAMAKTAGEKEVTVELGGIAKELDAVVNDKVLLDKHPEVVAYAKRMAMTFRGRKSYTPEEAQQFIAIANADLEAYYRNPTPGLHAKTNVDAMIANNLRKSTDDAITSVAGAGYQELKNKYGALATIENDVARAAHRTENKNEKGLIDFTDIFSAGDLIHGITSLDPSMFARGIVQNMTKNWIKRLNSADRMVEKMFERTEAEMLGNATPLSRLIGAVGGVAKKADELMVGGEKAVIESAKSPSMGMSIKDVSKEGKVGNTKKEAEKQIGILTKKYGGEEKFPQTKERFVGRQGENISTDTGIGRAYVEINMSELKKYKLPEYAKNLTAAQKEEWVVRHELAHAAVEDVIYGYDLLGSSGRSSLEKAWKLDGMTIGEEENVDLTEAIANAYAKYKMLPQDIKTKQPNMYAWMEKNGKKIDAITKDIEVKKYNVTPDDVPDVNAQGGGQPPLYHATTRGRAEKILAGGFKGATEYDTNKLMGMSIKDVSNNNKYKTLYHGTNEDVSKLSVQTPQAAIDYDGKHISLASKPKEAARFIGNWESDLRAGRKTLGFLHQTGLSNDAKVVTIDDILKDKSIRLKLDKLASEAAPIQAQVRINKSDTEYLEMLRDDANQIIYKEVKRRGIDAVDYGTSGKKYLAEDGEVRVFNDNVIKDSVIKPAYKGGDPYVKSPPAKQPPEFKGFTDLSTKLVEKLKGRSMVSKQFISDLTNSADVRQPERELIRSLLEGEGDTVNVKKFADKVKAELLPLKRFDVVKNKITTKYESISLPDELRGPIENYRENVYKSPIQTSAGDVHFQGKEANNYFAHTRIEDLPAKTGTRRVIELQSDLFQKGRLEESVNQAGLKDAEKYFNEMEASKKAGFSYSHSDYAKTKSMVESFKKNPQANPDLLEPYRNTWHERVIREEVKQAAKDGKTKLQFPTGETAMKIEGLGDANTRWTIDDGWVKRGDTETLREIKLTKDNMKVGKTINAQGGDTGGDWIITDVLGDGKFKAVSKDIVGKWKGVSNSEQHIESAKETFDISGKVDTNNPIYRFYNKEVANFLKNNFKAKPITDSQGVTWMEVPITKELKKMPVMQYGSASQKALIGGGILAGLGMTAARYASPLSIAIMNSRDGVDSEGNPIQPPVDEATTTPEYQAQMDYYNSGGYNKGKPPVPNE